MPDGEGKLAKANPQEAAAHLFGSVKGFADVSGGSPTLKKLLLQ